MAQIKYLDSRRIMGASGDYVETPTFEDDFSGTDDWTDSNANITVNTSTDVIDFDWTASSSNISTSYDLSSPLNNENWILDFDIRFSTLTQGSNAICYFSLSDSDSSTSQTASQDSLMGCIVNVSGVTTYHCRDTDGTAPSGASAEDTKAITWATNTTYYARLRRISSTSYGFEIFSDSVRTTSVNGESIGTCASTTVGLQYIKFFNVIDGTNGGVFIGTIDNVKVWNGISSTTSKPKQALSLSGCKAYYNFEQTSGSLTNIATTANGFDDGLGSSADGTNNGATTGSTGKVGSYAWDFDGTNDYVVLNTNLWSGFGSGNNWSINLWVNPDTLGSNIISHNTNNDDISIQSNGRVRIYLDNSALRETTTKLISSSQWNMITITYNGTYNIYVNNQIETSYSDSGSSGLYYNGGGGSVTRLGHTDSNNRGYFNGKIDEFVFFNRALSSSEISALYNGGTGVAVNDSSLQAKPETNSIFIETDTAWRYWFDGSDWGIPYLSDAIIMGGQTSNAGFPNVSASEEYNGTTWSAGGSLTGNRGSGGSGGTGSTSARYVQGYNDSPSPYPNSNRNEEYNGTSWSSDTVHPSATNNKNYSGTGLTDDFIIGSGHRNGTGDINETYVWNGSSWASKTALSTGSYSSWNGSSSIDNLITSTSSAWTWNGTSFTSSTATNTSRSYAWKSGTNSNDGFRASTGGNGNNTSEKWNGSSWTNTGNIPSTIGYSTSCGSTGDSSIHVGGLQSQTTAVSSVYEFNVDVFRTNSSLSGAKFYMGGAGQ